MKRVIRRSQWKDILTLFLTLVISYSHVFFYGQANMLLLIIIILNFKEIKTMPASYIIRLGCITALGCIFFALKGMTLELWIIRTWIIGTILCCIYRIRITDFSRNFEKLAELSAIYSLLHVPAYLLLDVSHYMNRPHILFLFWFNTTERFWGVPRVTGYAWEPSCWSYILIVNLIYVLYNRKSKKHIFLALAAIAFCNSTTVLMSTAVILAVHSYFIMKRNKWTVPFITAVAIIVFPLFEGKLNEKLNSGSGLARLSDFYILIDVMKTSPITGANALDVSNSSLAYRARQEALSDSGLNINEVGADGYFGEEMVNDFAAILVDWGILLGPFILYLYLLTPLLKGKELKILFLAGTIAVLSGTPISRTPIFFLFPISVLIMIPRYIFRPKKSFTVNLKQKK